MRSGPNQCLWPAVLLLSPPAREACLAPVFRLTVPDHELQDFIGRQFHDVSHVRLPDHQNLSDRAQWPAHRSLGLLRRHSGIRYGVVLRRLVTLQCLRDLLRPREVEVEAEALTLGVVALVELALVHGTIGQAVIVVLVVAELLADRVLVVVVSVRVDKAVVFADLVPLDPVHGLGFQPGVGHAGQDVPARRQVTAGYGHLPERKLAGDSTVVVDDPRSAQPLVSLRHRVFPSRSRARRYAAVSQLTTGIRDRPSPTLSRELTFGS